MTKGAMRPLWPPVWIWSMLIATWVAVGASVVATILLPARLTQASVSSGERELASAAMLRDKELYTQSADAYGRAILSGTLAPDREANASYILGVLCMDHLSHLDDALGWFYRADATKQLSQETQAEVARRIVSCLETLGRSRDARQELERSTGAGETPPAAGAGQVVARIGTREITEGEVDQAIQRLPPNLRQRFEEDAGRQEFVTQYVASEVVYAAAQRKGLNQDSEIVRRSEEFKKDLMVAKYVEAELQGKGQVGPEDARLFFEAHKEEFAKPEWISMSHILLANASDAAAALSRIEAGEPFEKVAEEMSKDETTRGQGGRLGQVLWGQTLGCGVASDELMAAARGAKAGDRGGPIQTSVGAHIFQVEDVGPQHPVPYEEVQDQVLQRLAIDRNSRATVELLSRLMDAEKVSLPSKLTFGEAKPDGP